MKEEIKKETIMREERKKKKIKKKEHSNQHQIKIEEKKKTKKQKYSEKLKPLIINNKMNKRIPIRITKKEKKNTPPRMKRRNDDRMIDEEEEGRILIFDDDGEEEEEEEYIATPTQYEEEEEEERRRRNQLRVQPREIEQIAITPPVVETSPVHENTRTHYINHQQQQQEQLETQTNEELIQELRRARREIEQLKNNHPNHHHHHHHHERQFRREGGTTSPIEEKKQEEDTETRRLEFFPYNYKIALHTISKFVMESMANESPIETTRPIRETTTKNESYYNVTKHQKEVEPHMLLFDIGEMLRVQKQIMEAVKYFKKSLELKETASANYRLGSIYFDIQAHDQALVYLQKAAAMGNGDAMTNIGCVYFAKQDYEKAMEYYIKGAEMGCYFANINIGKCYISGFGVPVDYQKAYLYLKVAIKMGSRNSAQNYLTRLVSKIIREQTAFSHM